MRRAALVSPAVLWLALSPPAWAAPPAQLTRIASSSVFAMRASTGVRAAFAFQRTGILIAADASSPKTVQVIASSGATSSGTPGRRDGGLLALNVGGVRATPLQPGEMRAVGRGSRAYVIGPPLGYEAAHIRAVVLPTVSLSSTRLVSVHWRLPAAFAGAPVVTGRGGVIGAVASVGPGHWQLAPRGRLDTLLERSQATAKTAVPILSFLIGGLLIFAAGLGLGISRSRRARQRTQEADQRRARRRVASRAATAQQPLVQLRSHEQAGAAPAADQGPEEDFDVILKPREDR